MNKIQRTFVIIQNSKFNFSAISKREILEIGSLSKTNLKISDLPQRHHKNFQRDDSMQEILNLLLEANSEVILLEKENTFLDKTKIIEKIAGDLNYLQNVDDFLRLNASIFQFENPKLIPENLSISDVCKTMLQMKYPYVMTVNNVWTPTDMFEVLRSVKSS